MAISWWHRTDRDGFTSAVDSLKPGKTLIAVGDDRAARDVAAELAAESFRRRGIRAVLIHCGHLPTIHEILYGLWSALEGEGSGPGLPRSAVYGDALSVAQLVDELVSEVSEIDYDLALIFDTVDRLAPFEFDAMRRLREFVSRTRVSCVVTSRADSGTAWDVGFPAADTITLGRFTPADVRIALLSHGQFDDVEAAMELMGDLQLTSPVLVPHFVYSQLEHWSHLG